MKSLAKDLVFARFKQNSTGKTLHSIEKLENSFLANMERLAYLNVKDFNHWVHYKYDKK